MNESLTVAQVQEIIQVSKKAIYDKINKEDFEEFIFKVKGVKYIKPKGIMLLKESFGEHREEAISQHFEEVENVKNVKNEVQKTESNNNDDLINEFKNRIKYLEGENSKLLDIIQQQNSLMKDQNSIIQNEQQITLNHTELLLVEKKEVLKLRQEKYSTKENRGFRKVLNMFK